MDPCSRLTYAPKEPILYHRESTTITTTNAGVRLVLVSVDNLTWFVLSHMSRPCARRHPPSLKIIKSGSILAVFESTNISEPLQHFFLLTILKWVRLLGHVARVGAPCCPSKRRLPTTRLSRVALQIWPSPGL